MAARHTSALQALLVDSAFDGDVYCNEPMARHTTYRIGGPARFYVVVGSLGALRRLVGVCESESVPWVVTGRGSNLLVADDGFPGVVIVLGRDFKTCRFDEDRMMFSVGAGVALSSIVQDAYNKCVSGLEFAVGTPGTVGGALRMNAGTRDAWLGDHVVSVTTLLPDGQMRRYAASELEWGYRTSSFAPDEVILEAEISVEKANPFYLRGKMESSLSTRRKTQPLNMPSCGSVFRNPEGHSVGRLIEDLGLKGCTIGGAQVSEVHANFIVNTGGATAEDVLALITLVKERVFAAHGIELTLEVKLLGF